MHLLLIEDDLDFGRDLQRSLELRGFTSVWLRAAAQALAHNSEPFDCVLLDLGLPDAHGLSVLRSWRSQKPQQPFIILTAHDALWQRVQGLEQGADDYVTKPVEIPELVARIQAVTRRFQAQQSKTWRFGEAIFCKQTCTVSSGGKTIQLTQKEFLILFELAKADGRVVTKAHLMASLSPLEPVSSNALEAHVRNLRKKTARQLIRTAHGIGYALERDFL